jgi:hypothetical protein
MKSSSDELSAALDKWNDSRLQWELAKSQLAQADSRLVPSHARALMKVQVDALEAQTSALFEAAMEFMERKPLGPEQ